MKRRSYEQGFTLLEVVIAMAILGISMGVFLQSQIVSLGNAARTRNLTVAALLARSKMVDIEQNFFDEGFVQGDTDESGTFTDDGHPEIKWTYRVSEIQLDLSALTSMCAGFGDVGGDSGACDGMLGALGAPLQGVTDEISRAMRAVELTVTWPDGSYSESMKVHALLTREDLTTFPGGTGLSPTTGLVPNPGAPAK